MTNSLDGPLITAVAAWIVFLVSLTGSRFASRSSNLPDHPNHRSSHQRVTSKAGGLAIIGAWLAGMFVVGSFSGILDTAGQALRLSGLAFLALALGFADDRIHLPPSWKLIGQFVIAALFVAAFSPLQSAPAPFLGDVMLGVVGILITILWIVAFMNAFNFMDGANGLAAGSAVVGLCGFCVIAGFSGAPFAAIAGFLLAVAAMGFMPSNLYRGALFMGDNGSQAVSFLIAALAVLASNSSVGRISALIVPVIFMPLLFDVFWTLLSRIMRRQNILTAHREHIYQLLIRTGSSHIRVSIIYMTLTAFSTAAAILMLTLAPAFQWITPAILCFLFAMGASKVHAKARREGLFAKKEGSAPTSSVASEAAPRTSKA